jgi:HTH-type transcriptional regulator/antitoxin HigA
MSFTASYNISAVMPAWQALQTRAPVKLCAIANEQHYKAMIAFMNELLDEVAGREVHPLAGLLDIVTLFVRSYEEEGHKVSPDTKPVAILRFLMNQHCLRQADLAEVFGAQSNVSEILNGKRQINARQARALAKRFGVSATVFI